MPNTQGPFGFRPVRRIDGSAPNYAMPGNPYQLAYNNGNTIARGDPVKLLSSGFIDLLAPGTTALIGIFWGCQYIDPTLQRTVYLNAWKAPSLASTVVVTAFVLDDWQMIFEAQAGGSASAGFVQGDIGNNAQFAGQGAPNSAGISVAYLDQSNRGTTNTFAFRVVGLSQKVGNDNTPGQPYNTAEVVFNNYQLRATTGI